MKGLGQAEKTIAEFSQTGIPHFKAKHQLYSLKANGRLIIVFFMVPLPSSIEPFRVSTYVMHYSPYIGCKIYQDSIILNLIVKLLSLVK